MKKLILLMISSFVAIACTMDCKSCHPKFNIEEDQHKDLKICITCHTTESISNVDMGSACGADCFSCHPVEKLNKLGVKEHSVMNSCSECHKSQNLNSVSFIDLEKNNLKSFLKK